MFDKKNKTARKSTDLATATVQATSISDQQREQIEQDMASFDPTWDGGQCQLTVPLDAATQEKLGQLVSMFPHGDVRLETTSGHTIIMSQAGGSGYSSDTSSNTPYASRQHDSDNLSQSTPD